jgi:hypothetical protein
MFLAIMLSFSSTASRTQRKILSPRSVYSKLSLIRILVSAGVCNDLLCDHFGDKRQSLLDLLIELFCADIVLHDLMQYQFGNDSSLEVAQTVVRKHWFEQHVHYLLLMRRKKG